MSLVMWRRLACSRSSSWSSSKNVRTLFYVGRGGWPLLLGRCTGLSTAAAHRPASCQVRWTSSSSPVATTTEVGSAAFKKEESTTIGGGELVDLANLKGSPARVVVVQPTTKRWYVK